MIGRMLRRALFAAGAGYFGRRFWLRRRGQVEQPGAPRRSRRQGPTYDTTPSATGRGSRAESIAGSGAGGWVSGQSERRTASPLGGEERRLP